MRDHPATLWAAGASFLLMVIGAVGASIAVVRIPADYFVRKQKRGRGVGPIFRNILGWLLVIAGLVMLVIPGPGAVALLAGLVLVDFPGRLKFLRWIITRTGVVKGMNRLRRRHGKPPLLTDAPGSTSRGTRRKARLVQA